MTLTFELAHEYLAYDPEDGELRWKISPNQSIAIGDVVGHVSSSGYIRFGFKGKAFLAHRVIWLMTHGDWPWPFIDHIDGDRLNNRLENLRVVDRAANNRNNSPHRSNSTGYTNIMYDPKRATPYKVVFNRDKKVMHYSTYDTLDEAIVASKIVAQELGDCRR